MLFVYKVLNQKKQKKYEYIRYERYKYNNKTNEMNMRILLTLRGMIILLNASVF